MMRHFLQRGEGAFEGHTFVCHTMYSLSVLLHCHRQLLSVEKSVCVAGKVAVLKCAIQKLVQNGE